MYFDIQREGEDDLVLQGGEDMMSKILQKSRACVKPSHDDGVPKGEAFR